MGDVIFVVRRVSLCYGLTLYHADEPIRAGYWSVRASTMMEYLSVKPLKPV